MTDIAILGERALRRLGVALVPIADRPMLTEMVAPETIATNALVALAVIAADETPADADQALALDTLRNVQARFTSRALVWWEDTGIPRACAEDYTKFTALMMAASFGKQADPNMVGFLENSVRQMALVLSSPDIAIAAVQAVHDGLAATGKVRWSVWDLPAAAELPYELLAANILAPGFDKQADAQAGALAMRLLQQVIALPSSGERVVAEYF